MLLTGDTVKIILHLCLITLGSFFQRNHWLRNSHLSIRNHYPGRREVKYMGLPNEALRKSTRAFLLSGAE